ncbi:hypothetical protein BDW71DRAFT_176509 [Aspergillus fruticulosus]
MMTDDLDAPATTDSPGVSPFLNDHMIPFPLCLTILHDYTIMISASYYDAAVRRGQFCFTPIYLA